MVKVKTFLCILNESGYDDEINNFASSKECYELISVTPTIFSDNNVQYMLYTVLYKGPF